MLFHKHSIRSCPIGTKMVPLFWWGVLLFSLLGRPLRADGPETYDARFFKSLAQQRSYLNQLETLLDSDQSPAKTRRHHQLARNQSSTDPRLDYALGLVLLKHFEYEQAEKSFQTASKIDQHAYLPAWKALIHLHLLQKDNDSFVRNTMQLAKLTAESGVKWTGPDQANAAAEWLGEVMQYLSLPKVDFLEPAAVTAHEARLKALIPPQRIGDYNRGKHRLRKKFNQLKQDIQQQQQQTKTNVQQSANQTTAQLSDRKKELNEQQEDARKSAVEWKAWYDKQMKQTQTQLTTLQKDYGVLETAGRRLNAMIVQLQLEVGQLQTVMIQQGQTPPRGTRIRTQPTANEQLLAVRQQELLRRQLQYSALEQQGLALAAKARQVLAARQQAANKYKNATGQIVQRDKTLDRWKNIVEKSSLKAAAKANDTDPIEALEKRLTMVGSYFPLDFETEKTRVLKSYEQP